MSETPCTTSGGGAALKTRRRGSRRGTPVAALRGGGSPAHCMDGWCCSAAPEPAPPPTSWREARVCFTPGCAGCSEGATECGVGDRNQCCGLVGAERETSCRMGGARCAAGGVVRRWRSAHATSVVLQPCSPCLTDNQQPAWWMSRHYFCSSKRPATAAPLRRHCGSGMLTHPAPNLACVEPAPWLPATVICPCPATMSP